MKIESKIGQSAYPSSTIYTFVSDFRNFNKFIPENKVSNWQAETDNCSFTMDLLGKLSLNIVERLPDKMIKISSDPKFSQYNFNLWIQLKEVAEDDTRIKVTIEPLLTQIMLTMVKGPLKSFVDSLVDEMEKFEY